MRTGQDMVLEDILLKAALEAGNAIMEIYQRGVSISYKVDASPVTEADAAAEAIILKYLAEAFPEIPVVAEETPESHINHGIGDVFFLVDPLDGTKEFIRRSDEFTVNIALIRNGNPVAGIVYAPAKAIAYRTNGQNGAEKLAIHASGDIQIATISCRPRQEPPCAVASRSHGNPQTDMFLQGIAVADCISVGSSLKFCLVAEGLADVYPRFGRTMEWDTAAGDAVLRAAGGMTFGPDDVPLVYGKTGQGHDCDFANPHFICWTMRHCN